MYGLWGFNLSRNRLHDAIKLAEKILNLSPRTRADFHQFSEMSENLETGWWMRQSAANHYLHETL
jgi:hypothetical protein